MDLITWHYKDCTVTVDKRTFQATICEIENINYLSRHVVRWNFK